MRREERHLEILPVTLRSFAALRMTTRTPPKSAHGKSYLQMSNERSGMTDTSYQHRSCQAAPLEAGITVSDQLPKACSLQAQSLWSTPRKVPDHSHSPARISRGQPHVLPAA